jgi:hypothetical protein
MWQNLIRGGTPPTSFVAVPPQPHSWRHLPLSLCTHTVACDAFKWGWPRGGLVRAAQQQSCHDACCGGPYPGLSPPSKVSKLLGRASHSERQVNRSLCTSLVSTHLTQRRRVQCAHAISICICYAAKQRLLGYHCESNTALWLAVSSDILTYWS